MNHNIHAGVKTAIITFFTLFAASLFGFLGDVQRWASDTTGAEHHFPSLQPLGKGFVSALAGALVGLVTFLINWGQANGKLPGKAAQYPDAPADPPPPADVPPAP